jgi:hypothetical protein
MIQVLVEFIVLILFDTVCGWTGNLVVRVITLGKVNLAWGVDSDSVVSEMIGTVFLVLLGITLFWLLR